MRRRKRFLVVLLATCGIAAGTGAVATAPAQTGVPTLTGETLTSCEFPPLVGGSGTSCTAGNHGSRTFTVRCEVDPVTGRLGVSRITWSVSGPAVGPYPGTYTETGSARFTRVLGATVVTEFSATFHIDSPLGQVDGRKYITSPTSAFTGCSQITDAQFGGDATHGVAVVNHPYEAIIKPVTGGAFADEGTAQTFVTAVTTGNAFLAERTSSTGSFQEVFTSSLPFAMPLQPTAKEQCKDQGFLTFGVFENQGDCVSFVETHGKNEPGKNQKG